MKICPEGVEEATQEPQQQTGDNVDVGDDSFLPFHVIKAPCVKPYVQDRHGKCRQVFA